MRVVFTLSCILNLVFPNDGVYGAANTLLGGAVAYGIVHRAIFESSVSDHWEACVTLMALIALADKDDCVFSDVGRLQRTTNFPERVLRRGLLLLLEPDADSRTPDDEGRRITFLPLLDKSQPSLDNCRGWHIVNRARYRAATKRAYMREYMRDYRKRKYTDPENLHQEGAADALEDFRR